MGNKVKLKMVGVETKKDKLGNKYQVVKTAPEIQESPCKQCKKNPRNQGSSRCEKCTINHRAQEINKSRLNKKIALSNNK